MPVAQRLTHVQRANNPILGCTQRQLDKRSRHAIRLRRQQRCQSTCDGGLSRSSLALDQHATDSRIHRGQQQLQLEFVLSDDGGKWIFGSHLVSSNVPVSAPPRGDRRSGFRYAHVHDGGQVTEFTSFPGPTMFCIPALGCIERLPSEFASLRRKR